MIDNAETQWKVVSLHLCRLMSLVSNHAWSAVSLLENVGLCFRKLLTSGWKQEVSGRKAAPTLSSMSILSPPSLFFSSVSDNILPLEWFAKAVCSCVYVYMCVHLTLAFFPLKQFRRPLYSWRGPGKSLMVPCVHTCVPAHAHTHTPAAHPHCTTSLSACYHHLSPDCCKTHTLA